MFKKLITALIAVLILQSFAFAEEPKTERSYGDKGIKEHHAYLYSSFFTNDNFDNFTISAVYRADYFLLKNINFGFGIRYSYSKKDVYYYDDKYKDKESTFGPLARIGYLFTISNNLYFDIAPAIGLFHRSISSHLYGKNNYFYIPVSINTSLKFKFSNAFFNVKMDHQFIDYRSSENTGWSDTYYYIMIGLGFSIFL